MTQPGGPRVLLSLSAALFGLLGLALLFLPRELPLATGLNPEAELPMQLLAGGFLSIAILNWAGRGAVYGGIYGRPLILANFAFGMITGGSLASAVLDGRIGAVGWVPTVVLLGHTLLFGWLMQSPPWSRKPPAPADTGPRAAPRGRPE